MVQVFIEFVELLDRFVFMAEDFHDLLAVHHFLNVAVHLAQFALLRHKVPAGIANQDAAAHKDQADHHDRNNRQRDAQRHHGDKDADHRNDAVEHLGHALADHLAQRIHVVCVDGHDIAVGVGVKKFDGQCLHMGEQVVTQMLHGSLGQVGHHPRLNQCGQNTAAIEGRRAQNGKQQARIIGRVRGQHRHNVAVDKGLHKQRALNVCQNADHNADNRNNGVDFVILHHIIQDAAQNQAGVFHSGARATHTAAAGAHFSDAFRHYASPPFFSSKSPPPCFWLLKTS